MNSVYYKKILEPHRRALEKIELDFEFFLRDVSDINISSIESRTKPYKSAKTKSQNSNIEIKNLDDLAGFRIIVGTHSEIPIIERFFTRQKDGKDLKILKRNEFKRKTGYRAVHLVIELNSHYLRSVYEGRVEIQIQTIFGNAFNFLSRAWRYKSNIAMSDGWNKKFLELSNNLNELEIIADNLHQEVVENMSINESSCMTPHSLIEITKQEFGEKIEQDNATDLCRFYSDMGYETNGQIRGFFQSKEVNELYEYLVKVAKDNYTVQLLVNAEKNVFWSFMGTRINTPTFDKVLNILINKN